MCIIYKYQSTLPLFSDTNGRKNTLISYPAFFEEFVVMIIAPICILMKTRNNANINIIQKLTKIIQIIKYNKLITESQKVSIT